MGIFLSLAGVAIVLVDGNFQSYAFVDLTTGNFVGFSQVIMAF